jgi:hypothetical protein
MKPFHLDHRRELAIAAELHGDPKCENQSPLHEEGGPGCKSPFWNLTERSGEVFFLDILSHRMSVTEMFRHFTRKNGGGVRSDL